MIVGGAQENTLLCCRDLITHCGDDVLLITGPALGPEGDLLENSGDEIPQRIIPQLRRSIHLLRDTASYFALRRALGEFDPQVVHTHSAKGGMLGRMAASALRIPAIIHTVHGAPFHEFQGRGARALFRWCEKFAAGRCHRLVSVADAMTERLVRAGVAPSEKFVTIYSGMDVEPFLASDQQRQSVREQWGFRPEHVVFTKIARLFYLKGHEYFIAAAQQVVATCPHARFMLVGDGLLRKRLTDQIGEAGLQENVVFTGLVPPDQIPGLLGATDVLVHCSLREGLARALPQALIAGKPVVSFDIDGAREVVINDQTGYLVAPENVSELSASMLALADDPQRRAQFGTAGRERFTDQFRHETMTAQLRELYEEVLREAGGGKKDESFHK
jgi:glycosyltransferase involved in cell wall biosynthesis